LSSIFAIILQKPSLKKVIRVEMLRNYEYAKPKEKLVFLRDFNQKNGYSRKGK
jgi:hypothetical protein